VGILHDRVDERAPVVRLLVGFGVRTLRGWIARTLRAEAVGALLDVPAVVATPLDDVGLLEEVLSVVVS
jgi:hypothetical protein